MHSWTWSDDEETAENLTYRVISFPPKLPIHPPAVSDNSSDDFLPNELHLPRTLEAASRPLIVSISTFLDTDCLRLSAMLHT